MEKIPGSILGWTVIRHRADLMCLHSAALSCFHETQLAQSGESPHSKLLQRREETHPPLLQQESSGIKKPKPAKSVPFTPIPCVSTAHQHGERQASRLGTTGQACTRRIHWHCPAGYRAPAFSVETDSFSLYSFTRGMKLKNRKCFCEMIQYVTQASACGR